MPPLLQSLFLGDAASSTLTARVPGSRRSGALAQQGLDPQLQLEEHLCGPRSKRDMSTFLGTAATAATSLHTDAPRSHSDFLFGGSGSRAAGQDSLHAVPSFPSSRGAAPPLSRREAAAAAPSLTWALKQMAAPKVSMLAGIGVVGGTVAETVRKKVTCNLDPFSDEEPEEPSGWTRVVPMGLRLFAAADLLGGALALQTWGMPCDVPLRPWLLGGILLGFPLSRVVQLVAEQRPRYKLYRLTVLRTRGGGDPETFRLGGLQLFDQLQQPISRVPEEVEEGPLGGGSFWQVSLRKEPLLPTSYQLLTHGSADPAQDPAAWTLEGSLDGMTWELLHQVDEEGHEEVPRIRSALTRAFEDLLHLEKATTSFRLAFLLEIVCNVASFAWLVAGTAWVGAGTETCVDSAPLLWYPCFLLVVGVWSFLGTATIGLIVSAVAMLVLGVRAPDA